jgi:hypothetical protein
MQEKAAGRAVFPDGFHHRGISAVADGLADLATETQSCIEANKQGQNMNPPAASGCTCSCNGHPAHASLYGLVRGQDHEFIPAIQRS